MTKLPDWVERIDKTVLSQGPLVEALSIAWEALAWIRKETVIAKIDDAASDAMRRIEILGGPKRCCDNGFFGRKHKW